VESKFAASKRDFLNKVVISLKEANETIYRLRLLKTGEFVSADYDHYLAEINFIVSILVKIVKTTRHNLSVGN
jgi:four helix bundle protein